MKLKCKFGVPRHGWLPVVFFRGDFLLELDSSDVPVDPIQHLVSALFKVLKGIDSKVWWHLEPAGYNWYFTKLEDENYQINITYQELSDSPEKSIICIAGSNEELILPLWRAVKEFYSHNYEEPHWPEVDNCELQKLTDLIKKGKNNHELI